MVLSVAEGERPRSLGGGRTSTAGDVELGGGHTGKHWSDLIRRACFNNFQRPSGLISSPAEECVLSLQREPSARALAELRRQLNRQQSDWTADFLRHNGLTALLDCLLQLCQKGYGKFSDALEQLECVQCVRAVMDSRIGLDYIVENKEYTQKLASALNTTNVTVKKQVFELLSALSVYSAEGYARALEALDHYKEQQSSRYRFRIVVDELRAARSQEYQTALLAFVNCVIISATSLKGRTRIRNEFIGLKILDVLSRLRRECDHERDADLVVQLDVFDEQRYTDEGQLTGPDGVDLNSHLDVFYAILRQVAETPQELPFLNILQHLLRIDSSQPVSDVVWDTAETLVHRASLLETTEDAEKLLRSSSYHHNLNKIRQCSCGKALGLLSPTTAQPQGANPFILNPPPPPPAPPPPPPPPPLPFGGCPLPPPPPPMPGMMGGPPPPPPPPPGCGPPPPPPPGPAQAFRLGAPPSASQAPEVVLPQQETPRPKNKMKSLNWNKIPAQNVVGKDNIWTRVAAQDQKEKLDFEVMEGLFCQVNLNGPASPRPGRKSDSLDRKKRELSEVILLDGKRSLNVNIFLKQFRSSTDEIINILREGLHAEIGAEKLRGLLRILPESDEVELLRGYDGDRSRLGLAERFLLQLVDIANYKLRIEGMLLKEEFPTNMEFLEPAIETIITAAREIMESESLRRVMYMILLAGNFLNSGGYAGNAAGFKIMSLLKLTDIRANKPGMNFIHYVAAEAGKKSPDLLTFPDQLLALDDASKLSIDNLKTDAANLGQKVQNMSKQVLSSSPDIRSQMSDFLKCASSKLSVVEESLSGLERTRRQLAEFLCEDLATFKLEEGFKVFAAFCQKYRAAVQENERRHQQEQKAEARRRHREDYLALKRKSSGGGAPFVGCYVNTSDLKGGGTMSGSEGEAHIMDIILGDIRCGFPQRLGDKPFKVQKIRKTTLDSGHELLRMNSQNSSVPSEEELTNSPRVVRRRIGSLTGEPCDSVDSPDITPNGSLRKRRSRLSSEDQDDNLIDYLRYAAEFEDRDRRSWGSADGGSLDRSWLRRSGRRSNRRQDLLTAEYMNERERPSSPSVERIHVETPERKRSTEKRDSQVSESEAEKPKIWRKKIEDWLQENEKEEVKDKKLLERLKMEQRRRLELESRDAMMSLETKPSLETLHEAKTDSEVYKRRGSLPKNEPPTPSPPKTEDVINQHVKDKSKWRKSTLNVANSTESVDDERRRSKSRRSNTGSLSDARSPSGDRSLDESIAALEEQKSEEKANTVIDEEKLKHNFQSQVEEKGSPLRSDRACPSVRETPQTEKVDAGTKTADDSVVALRSERVPIESSEQRDTVTEAERSAKRALRYKQMVQDSQKVSEEVPVTGEPESEESNFDRFSAIRKTTRRARGKSKTSDQSDDLTETDYSEVDCNQISQEPPSTTKEVTKPASLTTADSQQAEVGPLDLRVKPQNDDKTSESLDQFKDPPEIKKKEKTSLRARLAKRLHSLTENIKAAAKSTENEKNVAEVERALSPVQVAKKEASRMSHSSPSEIMKAEFTLEDGSSTSVVPDTVLAKQTVVSVEVSQNPTAQVKPKPDPSKSPTRARDPRRVPPSPHMKRRGTEEHENDEGFEETQSLLSETHSQGNGSSCGHETDSLESPSVSPRHTEEISPPATETVTASSLRSKPSLIPSPVLSRRREPPVVRKVESSQVKEIIRGPVRRQSSIPSRIGTPKPVAKPPETSRSTSHSSLRSSKSSLSCERPSTGRQSSVIRSSSVGSELRANGGRIPRPVGETKKVFRTPSSSSVQSLSSNRKPVEKSQSNKTVIRPVARSLSNSRVPTLEPKKTPSKSPLPARAMMSTTVGRPANGSFGFMRATSASAKKQITKPLDEIQKVRVKALTVSPSRVHRPLPSGIRSGGAK